MDKAIEQRVIDQLTGYKRLCGRIELLHFQPIGMGLSIEHDGSVDALQALHKELKDKPSYMYLTDKQQQLEQTAFAYLVKYPVGTKAQLNEVKNHTGYDEQDKANLKELARQIQKVIDARNGEGKGNDAIIRRLAALQDANEEKDIIDKTLDSLSMYKPELDKLLRLRYINGFSVEEVANELGIVRKTFDRWRPKALEEYSIIAGMSQTCP